MVFEYNKENFKRVINSKDILYFKVGEESKRKYIYAMTNSKKFYERIDITIPQNLFSFPQDALYRFYSEGGHLCLDNENYIFIDPNTAINKNSFVGFKYITIEDYPEYVFILAKFNDKSATIIDMIKQSSFKKHGIEKYSEILKKNNITTNDSIINTEDNIIEVFLNNTHFITNKHKVYTK